MFRPVDRRALSSAREGLFLDRRVRIECLRRLTKFAAASAVLWLATTSFAVTANAAEANVRDDTFSALRDYVQVIDTGRKSIADAGPSSSQPRQIHRRRVRGIARIYGTNWRRAAGADRGPAEIGRS